MILLGCVSPFAIRLSVERVGKSGRTAGQLYAISTAGSILGTFLPVLWLIPTIGTYRTFFVFAVSLLLVSIVGLIVTRLASSPPRPGKSLLPIGVVRVEGIFDRGEVVGCFSPENVEVARGLINYGAQETARILRKPTAEIEAILGYIDEPELIHRDNLVLLG